MQKPDQVSSCRAPPDPVRAAAMLQVPMCQNLDGLAVETPGPLSE